MDSSATKKEQLRAKLRSSTTPPGPYVANGVVQVSISRSGDPAVYNRVCLCSFNIDNDGSRRRVGPKCIRCSNVIRIILPSLDPSATEDPDRILHKQQLFGIGGPGGYMWD